MPQTLKPFSIAFQHAAPHGIVAAFHIPNDPAPVPDHVLEQLHHQEAEYARSLRKYRQVSFVGGRLALRTACQQVGIQAGAMLPDDRGAPSMPEGLIGSVSHKRTLAIAMISRDHGDSLGVDLEDYGPPRLGIANSVLTEGELSKIADLEDDRRWLAILLRFSLKESVYKALDPYVRRYVGFKEAIVDPDTDGRAKIELDLSGKEGPFDIDARYSWLHGRLMTSVRIHDRSVQPARPVNGP